MLLLKLSAAWLYVLFYCVIPSVHCAYFSKYVQGSLEDPKTLTHHKLIHAASERILTDTKTVADENLKDKGMIRQVSKDVDFFLKKHNDLPRIATNCPYFNFLL